MRLGVWVNSASGFCEWKGPPWMPPPDGAQITIGALAPQRSGASDISFLGAFTLAPAKHSGPNRSSWSMVGIPDTIQPDSFVSR